jgi:tetratricopeptide (TPR) repeat protein
MLVGQILQERYHLIAQISHGSWGRTYMALDKSTSASLAKSKYIIKHFSVLEREPEKMLKIAAQLQQLNGISDRLPQLIEYWRWQDQLFLAYEYIDSQCLETELIANKMWPEKFVISILAEIMEVLQPLHQKNIGHGSLHWRQLGRRSINRQMTLTDTGLIKLINPQLVSSSDSAAIDEAHLIQQDLKNLGYLAIQLLTGVKIEQLVDTPGKLTWRQQTNCREDFAALIDRLITTDLSQQWSSVVPAWVKLSQIMNQILTQQQICTTNEMTDFNSHHSLELKQQADQKFLQGNAAGAVADYGELIKLDPQPLHYHNRGIIYAHELGAYHQALQDYDTTLALKPDFASAYQNRANVQRLLGNLPAAIADYSQCIQLLPNLAIIYWDRGLAYQQLGDLPAAVSDYTKFLTYQPYHAVAYYQRGNVYQQLGHNTAALADYNQAVQVNPQSAKAYYNRGAFYEQQGELATALNDYSQAIKHDPQLAIAFQQRGGIYQQQGDLAGALANYQHASNLAPTADIYHLMGLVNVELGDLAAALIDYNRALALNPKLVQTYNNRGIIKRRQKDLLGAINDYSQGLSIEPTSLDCLRNRGIARQELQDYPGAVADYRRAANLHLGLGQQFEYEKILTIINTLQRYC